MNRVLPCMSATTLHTNMRTDVSANSSSDLGKPSPCEHGLPTLFSFGDDSLTIADRRELIALFSEMNPLSAARSLSDRLTPSLFTSGLISGITPTSIRERFEAAIPDFVLSLPDGGRVEQQSEGCSFLKGNRPCHRHRFRNTRTPQCLPAPRMQRP